MLARVENLAALLAAQAGGMPVETQRLTSFSCQVKTVITTHDGDSADIFPIIYLIFLTSVVDPHWFQCGSWSGILSQYGSRSKVLETKNCKNLFFWLKFAIFFISGPLWWTSKLQEKHSALKIEYWNMKFLHYLCGSFLLSWNRLQLEKPRQYIASLVRYFGKLWRTVKRNNGIPTFFNEFTLWEFSPGKSRYLVNIEKCKTRKFSVATHHFGSEINRMVSTRYVSRCQ